MAREQHPDKNWLAAALAEYTQAQDGEAYIHFGNSANPNQLGSAWQFEQNITLEHPIHEEIVVDLTPQRYSHRWD
jgi:hypothetical protein